MTSKQIKDEIIPVLKEMREASAACFRVIYAGNLVGHLEMELKKTKVQNGFGTRCQELIGKLESNK